MSDSVQPQRRQPTRLPHPWDSPGKNTGVGCHFLLQCMKWKVKVKLLSRVRLLATPWTAAYQAPPSMGFSRQVYWSGVPLCSPLNDSSIYFIVIDYWHITRVLQNGVGNIVLNNLNSLTADHESCEPALHCFSSPGFTSPELHLLY